MKSVVTTWIPPAIIMLLLFLITGCNVKDTGTMHVHDLEIWVNIEPEVVKQGEDFKVTVSLKNTSSEKAGISTYCVNWFYTSVWKEGESASVEGGNRGCRPMVNFYELQPGEVLKSELELVANSYVINSDTGKMELIPSPPGLYDFMTHFTISSVNGVGTNVSLMRHRFVVVGK